MEVIELIKSFFVTVLAIFQLLPGVLGNVKSYEPEKENPSLNAVVVSDIHTDGNIFRDRTTVLREVFAGISENKEDIDAVIIAGDITNSGSETEYENLSKLTDFYLKADNIVAAMGNHDSWNGSDDPNYDIAENLFIDYVNNNGFKTDKTYYTAVINGYYFINMGPESLILHETKGTISKEQLEWLNNQLTEAKKTGKPIFVINHFPLINHNGVTDSDGYEQSVLNSIDLILNAQVQLYSAPVVYISGHIHTLTDKSFDKFGNVYYLNMPSTLYTDDGGYGVTVEDYNGQLIMKLRNFITDEWVKGYEYRIDYKVK